MPKHTTINKVAIAHQLLTYQETIVLQNIQTTVS